MLITVIILGILTIIFVTVGGLISALIGISSGIELIFHILAIISFLLFVGLANCLTDAYENK